MSLELSIEQKQTLSARMRLSTKILQMNTLDLEQYLKESALENPVIEFEVLIETEPLDNTIPKEIEWVETLDESNSFYDAWREDNGAISETLHRYGESDSLTEALLLQLSGFGLPQELECAVRYLINCLDENGYLMKTHDHPPCKYAERGRILEDALEILQRMDPPGVGARDLQECLLIQSKRLELSNTLVDVIIRDNLDLLSQNKLVALAKILGVPLEDIKEAHSLIRSLNPKPGNGHTVRGDIPYIYPELLIVGIENEYQVITNDYRRPKLEISDHYRELAKSENKETAAYLKDKIGQAEWLASCINRRRDTILRCAKVILSGQKKFFKYGPGNLAPLSLTDVASALGLHPSTVSRAISGKYLQCRWGVFALGDFFHRNIGDEKSDLTQEMVIGKIADIIEKEDHSRPHSDEDISHILRENGISIARRTVAKYRGGMNIPPAARRKKF